MWEGCLREPSLTGATSSVFKGELYLVVWDVTLVYLGDDILSGRPKDESTGRGLVKGRGSSMPCDC